MFFFNSHTLSIFHPYCIHILRMFMSAGLDTPGRRVWTVEAEKLDTCGGRIGQCRRRRFIGA